jgi:hypothetical protein
MMIIPENLPVLMLVIYLRPPRSWKSSLTDGEANSTPTETRGGAGRDTHERPSRYMYWRRLLL